MTRVTPATESACSSVRGFAERNETQDNTVFQNNAQLSELAKQLNRPDQIVTKPPEHIGADPD